MKIKKVNQHTLDSRLIKLLLNAYGFTFSKKDVDKLLSFVGNRTKMEIDRKLDSIAVLLEGYMKVV